MGRQQICSSEWCYHVTMDQNLWGTFPTLLNLCHKALKLNWVQPGTSKVYLEKCQVSVHNCLVGWEFYFMNSIFGIKILSLQRTAAPFPWQFGTHSFMLQWFLSSDSSSLCQKKMIFFLNTNWTNTTIRFTAICAQSRNQKAVSSCLFSVLSVPVNCHSRIFLLF